MENLKHHLRHIALPAMLVILISSGATTLLEVDGIGIPSGLPSSKSRMGTPSYAVRPSFTRVALVHPVGTSSFSFGSAPYSAAQNPGLKANALLGGAAVHDTLHPSGIRAFSPVKPNPDTVIPSSHLPIARDTLSTAAAKDTTALRSVSTQVGSANLPSWLQKGQPGQPQASIFTSYHYPLFLYSAAIQHSALIDTSGRYVNIRETVLGNDVRIPIRVSLDKYINLREKHTVRTIWENLAHSYTLTETTALGNLMQGVTNINIPIPKNPLMSIFGPPTINLRISGSVDIHGAWQNQKLNAQSLSQLGNVTNSPDFSQDLSINVNGTVGNKLSIGANWDTQNQFNYENQVHIKYTGYSDDIIKSIQAGNVSMSTPNSFIGGSQALFGVKSKLQFGALTITALASQQKAQSQTLTVTGGSQSQPISLHAYDYATNHFLIDTMYAAGYQEYLQSAGTQWPNPDLNVTDYEVYVSQPIAQPSDNLRKGYAVMNLPAYQADSTFYDSLEAQSNANTTPGLLESGRFQKLSGSDFDLNPQTGVLTLNTNLTSDQIVAIAYSTRGGATYGTFSYQNANGAPLILKLVRPANLLPSETEAWSMLLKNIYPTGGYNLTPSSLQNVQIMYQLPGQPAQNNIEGINLLQIMGLDKHGPSGTGPPDGVMDWSPGVDIDPTSGEIIFPYLEPFVQAFSSYRNGGQQLSSPDSFAYPEVYDTTVTAAQNDATHDRFLITGSYTSSVSSHYNLGFNLVQGSVHVLLNGQPLNPNTDYSVNYSTGEVTITDQSALVPNANVQIQYQTNDIFQVGSKSLVGARAAYKVNDQTSLGITMMNYTQQSPNNIVRLGEEPISNWILGFDGGTSAQLPFLTKALNFIPLIHTAAPSRITVHGEAAYMMPNPNTQASPIPDDHGKGMAFIDDFEGAKRTIPLPIDFSNWTIASPPAVSILDSLHSGLQDSTRNYYRGWTYWYNIQPSDVTSQQIWPQKQQLSGQVNPTVLNIGFLPTVRGQFNRTHDAEARLNSDPEENWGGIMTVLSSGQTDLLTQNVNYIEIWMKIDGAPGNGTMHIDLGQVSEDVVGDGVLHTEDPFGNGTLVSDTLDYGIDGLTDAQERADFPWIVDDPDRPWDVNGTTRDPDGDDYEFSSPNLIDTTYYRINGTEGNATGNNPYGKLPDTEDLLHNGVLQLTNSYYEYAVPLDTSGNRFIAGGGNDGWYQFLIPLQDYQRAVGNPSLSNVQFVRLWFNGMTGPMMVRIAELNLVGNSWRTPDQTDTTMEVSVVSVFDTPGYKPPVPGLAPIDNSNPSGPVQLNEHSLDLVINGLQDGDSRYAYKTFSQAMNLFNYKTMKVYVHGDPSFTYADSTDYDASFFIRFGSDSLNFYEYRQPIQPGWHDLEIQFPKLTAIKQERDSVTATIKPVSANNGVPGATYWVEGNPSLQSISYFQMGITNPKNVGTTAPLYGNVWVDALRLTNVNNTPGWAYTISTSLQLADLGSVNLNYTNTDPYFHSLTTQFGSLNSTTNWGINASFSLSKFLPREWVGTSIPFSFSHNESFSNPLYLPNSDILVSEAVSKREAFLISKGMSRNAAAAAADSLLVSSQVLTISDQWAIPTMHIVIPSDQWYVKDLLDDITMGFDWSGSKSRSPQIQRATQWAWNYNAAYSVQFDPMAYFTPFPSHSKVGFGNNRAFGIRFLPNSLSLSMTASRSLSLQKLRTQQQQIVTPNFTAERSGSIDWKLTNNGILNPTISYRFSVNSTLLPLESDTAGTGGALQLLPDSYVFGQIFLNHGVINFGQDYNFTENFSITTQPHLPLQLNRYVNLSSSYNSDYTWTNSFEQKAVGKSAGYSASLNLGSSISLKALTTSWFSSSTTASAQRLSRRGPFGRRRGRAEFETPSDTSKSSGFGANPLGNLFNVAIKVPFLDFNNIGITFSSSNSAQNGGLPSLRPGMGNFFMVPFIQKSDPRLGPSQLYQLGLVSDPYGELTFFTKKGFPFFGFAVAPGRRVPNADIADNFSNSNTLNLTADRNLWPGAGINLSWHVSWSYNRNTTFQTGPTGSILPSTESQMISGEVTRSFFTLPPVFLFSAFKNGINRVGTIYKQLQEGDPNNVQSTDAQKISQAFVQGFETLPIIDKILGPYAPRLNYDFHWNGLQNIEPFKSFASQVTLENAYQSTYSDSWHEADGQPQVTDAQTINYGFQPLIGLNVTFRNLGNAALSGSVLYNTSTQYALNPSAGTISESYSGQLSITASYAKSGFSLPMFGLNLRNNVDITASYSTSENNLLSYTVSDISAGGQPLNGTSQTNIQLRFQYQLSQWVTASIFYKDTRVVPTAPGSLTPGTTTNEAGIDVHVTIS